MNDNHQTAAAALAHLERRAAEHEASKSEEYQEYAAGIRDAMQALKPFLVVSAQQTFEQFLGERMPGCDDAQRLIARKAWNAGLATLDRGRVEKVVNSYVTSPMLVDELMHVVKAAAA